MTYDMTTGIGEKPESTAGGQIRALARIAVFSWSLLPGLGYAVPPALEPCSGRNCWHPASDSRWQYQLQGVSTFSSTGGINVNIAAVPFTGGAPVTPVVFDIDLYIDPAVSGNNGTINTAAVDAIHAKGGRAICYVSAGTWESWRPDADRFPNSVKGRKVSGFANEQWLDIRNPDVVPEDGQYSLLEIMEARVQKCVEGRFDAVEWDNVDGYANRTGFPLTYQNQFDYDATLANLAHQYGLTVALKNNLEQVDGLVGYFDFAINEQCNQYGECDVLAPFLSAGKAVFQVEYQQRRIAQACSEANLANRSAIRKSIDLYDTPWLPCR